MSIDIKEYPEDQHYLSIDRADFIKKLKNHDFYHWSCEIHEQLKDTSNETLNLIYENKHCSPELRAYAFTYLRDKNVIHYNYGLAFLPSFIDKSDFCACAYYYLTIHGFVHTDNQSIIDRLTKCVKNGYTRPLFPVLEYILNPIDKNHRDLLADILIMDPCVTFSARYINKIDLLYDKIKCLSNQLSNILNNEQLTEKQVPFPVFHDLTLPAQIKSIQLFMSDLQSKDKQVSDEYELYISQTVKSVIDNKNFEINARIFTAFRAARFYSTDSLIKTRESTEMMLFILEFIRQQAEQFNNPLSMFVYHDILSRGFGIHENKKWVKKSLELGCAESLICHDREFPVFSVEEYAFIARLCVKFPHFLKEFVGINDMIKGFALCCRQLQQTIETEASFLPKTGSVYLHCEKEFEKLLK